MELVFECTQKIGNRTVKWDGHVQLLRAGNPSEMIVTARGSYFHVIFGESSYGRYLCIPNWGVGNELADLMDLFWNTERLSKSMKKVDAISVASALAAAKKALA
jgi:hypothetical protein